MRNKRDDNVTTRAWLYATRRGLHRIIGHLAKFKFHILELGVIVEHGGHVLFLTYFTRAKVKFVGLNAKQYRQRCARYGQLGALVIAEHFEIEKYGVVTTRRRFERGREAVLRIAKSLNF